jgi:uncharacterized membrane protein YeaQ/YmgE (transglycosylase-associated protein family)
VKQEAVVDINGLIAAVVVGAIIGALGRLVVPGKQRIGCLLTVGIGILAALLGTAVASALNVAHTRGIDWIQLVIQVGFAAVGVALVAGGTRRR